MKNIKKYLEKVRAIRKKKYHPLIHKIHKKHMLSKKTLFYIKEYGPNTNVSKTIIKESIKILLIASIISAFGGLALEHVKTIFVSIIPLIILLPVLNDMIGDYGTIISSRFSTMLYEGKVNKKWWAKEDIKVLFLQIFIIAIITAFISSLVALILSGFSNYKINLIIALKILLIALIDIILLVSILFLIAVTAGLYLYRKKEDPNNFLIPITTSLADFGNMVLLAVLVILFF